MAINSIDIIKVLVIGYNGKMGKELVTALSHVDDCRFVGGCARGDDLEEKILIFKPDVAVDFSLPESVFSNAKLLIKYGISPVIGASGLNEDQIEELRSDCDKISLGGLIAPNFSLGALLMMECAKHLYGFFSEAEIIEYHNINKKDSPSATAIATKNLMQQYKNKFINLNLENIINSDKVRDIPIHSVRLSGAVAHQEVILSSMGENLTLRHDCINRQSFMPGVILACRKVKNLDTLYYGLNKIIDLSLFFTGNNI